MRVLYVMLFAMISVYKFTISSKYVLVPHFLFLPSPCNINLSFFIKNTSLYD